MRVVSLCPSLTETVFALGAGATLVGRTKFCIHPRPAVDAVARVGGTKNPDVAKIVALAPDLVLLNEEENRREDADALAAAGLRCLSSFPRDVAGASSSVRALGAALGGPAGPAATQLADQIDARAAEVAATAAGRPPVRFAYLIWRNPWMTVAGDTYISALLTLAGGENVFAARTPRYPTITPADLTAAAPDVVLLSSEPYPFKPKHIAELAPLRARLADGELLSWHGARTLEGLTYAGTVLPYLLS